MLSDTSVYRAASRLIERHGPHAVNEATRAMEKLLCRGHPERLLVWFRIKHAIVLLETPPSRALH